MLDNITQLPSPPKSPHMSNRISQAQEYETLWQPSPTQFHISSGHQILSQYQTHNHPFQINSNGHQPGDSGESRLTPAKGSTYNFYAQSPVSVQDRTESPSFFVPNRPTPSISESDIVAQSPSAFEQARYNEDEVVDFAALSETERDSDHSVTATETDSNRRRLKRFRLNHAQTKYLLDEFARQMHPDAAHRERLAQAIPGLSPRQVQVWFQNRRAKTKRLKIEDQTRMVQMRALPDGFDWAPVLNPQYNNRTQASQASEAKPSGAEHSVLLAGADGITRPPPILETQEGDSRSLSNVAYASHGVEQQANQSRAASIARASSSLPTQPLTSGDLYGNSPGYWSGYPTADGTGYINATQPPARRAEEIKGRHGIMGLPTLQTSFPDDAQASSPLSYVYSSSSAYSQSPMYQSVIGSSSDGASPFGFGPQHAYGQYYRPFESEEASSVAFVPQQIPGRPTLPADPSSLVGAQGVPQPQRSILLAGPRTTHVLHDNASGYDYSQH